MGDDAKPQGAGGWRKAFLGLWTASFVLAVALGVAILPGRVGHLRKMHQAVKIPMPAVADGAVAAAAWIPENLLVLAAVWGGGAVVGLVCPRGGLKILTALSILMLLGVAGAGAAMIRFTDPSQVPSRPPPIPLGRSRLPPYNYATTGPPGGARTPASAVETSGEVGLNPVPAEDIFTAERVGANDVWSPPGGAA